MCGGVKYLHDLDKAAFIADELASRIRSGSSAESLEKVGQFLNMPLDDAAAATRARELLGSDAFGLSLDNDDAVPEEATGYFTGLANAGTNDKQRITIHALQELQRALRPAYYKVVAHAKPSQPQASVAAPAKPSAAKPSTELTLEEAAAYLAESNGLTDYLKEGSITPETWEAFRQVAQKNFETFKNDPKFNGGFLDQNLLAIERILDQKDMPKEGTDDLGFLIRLMSLVRKPQQQETDESIATLRPTPELTKVFKGFKNFFEEQATAIKASEIDPDAPSTAVFKSVETISETEVKVKTQSGETATITHNKPNTKNQSLNVVGSMKAVVDTIVAIYKAEGITKLFSINVDDLQLTNSKGVRLAEDKLTQVAALLDERFKAEFNTDPAMPLYEAGSAIASAAKPQSDPRVGASLKQGQGRPGWQSQVGTFAQPSVAPPSDDYNGQEPAGGLRPSGVRSN